MEKVHNDGKLADATAELSIRNRKILLIKFGNTHLSNMNLLLETYSIRGRRFIDDRRIRVLQNNCVM